MERPGWRVPVATVGIAANLALLVLYKYVGFVVTQLNAVLGTAALPVPHLTLPLGISFSPFRASPT